MGAFLNLLLRRSAKLRIRALRNVSKLHSEVAKLLPGKCPKVASELVRDIFEFFDLFFQGKFVTCRLVARSLLVLSATINIWGGAQGICDAEECRKLAVCFRSEAGSCSRYFEISQLSKSSLHKLRAFIEKFWDRNVYKV